MVDPGGSRPPQTAQIATDESTVRVFVDGASVGAVTYSQVRADIHSSFPGYANAAGAVGYRRLDTTAMTNGMHSIAWIVMDNPGGMPTASGAGIIRS